MEKCLCRLLLTSCALFARLAPKALNAAVISRYYLAFFAGNVMVGRVGEMYETMPTTQFWLLHAGFTAVAGTVFLLFKLTLARRLMRNEPAVLQDG